MTHDPQKESELERRLRERIEREEENENAAGVATDLESNPDNDQAPSASVLQEEIGSLNDQLLRARAEFENYRKRTAREVDRIRKIAAESLIHGLLPVLDNLELALKHAENKKDPLAQGVKMVLKQMTEVLERNGLEPVDAVGKPFDPNVHEAVAQSESQDVPADHVVDEYQRGYLLGGQMLRPSKVVVSRGDEAPAENNS